MHKIKVHNGQDNMSDHIESLYHQEEETKLEEAFENSAVHFVRQGVTLEVADSNDQNSERNDGRENREEYAVNNNKHYRI